jgi:dynein heavy chain, axonemal
MLMRFFQNAGKKYSQMDRTWRRIMGQTKANPLVIQVCADEKLLDSLKECNRLLDTVQKGLAQYLETKRAAFPRLYFLSNDELLEILSQAKDPTAVQPHLRKCFENISRLEFSPDLLITAMFSSENERVEFCKHFHPRGNVESWLLEVETVMKRSVKETLKAALAAYSKTPRTEWVQTWPGQLVLAGSQVFWTRDVTHALEEGPTGVQKLHKTLLQQLDDLTKLVRGDLTPLARLTLGSLIVNEVHARDVVQRLYEAGKIPPFIFYFGGKLSVV